MKKILIVDDDIDLIMQYTPVLQQAGYQVSAAYNGQEGFEKFQAEKPDVMIVDLAMEHFDSGFRLCRQVKKTAEGQKIPVIIMTSAAHETGIALSVGTEEEKQWIAADDYLEKPVSAKDLLLYLKEKIFKD